MAREKGAPTAQSHLLRKPAQSTSCAAMRRVDMWADLRETDRRYFDIDYVASLAALVANRSYLLPGLCSLTRRGCLSFCPPLTDGDNPAR